MSQINKKKSYEYLLLISHVFYCQLLLYFIYYYTTGYYNHINAQMSCKVVVLNIVQCVTKG